MRNRSSAIAITNNQKIRMSQDLSALENIKGEDEKKQKITNYIEEKLNLKRSISTSFGDSNISVPPPQYLDIKKDYNNNNDKPILFHEKAKLVDNLDKKYIGEIESYSQHIDFESFLAQFKSQEEINQFEVYDLFNFDFDKIEDLKEKVTEYSEITSNLIENTNEEGSEDLLVFFCEKLNEIKKNEISLQLFVDNIEKVDGLLFSENRKEIYFKR